MRALGGRSTALLTNYDQAVLALVLAGLEGEVVAAASCTASWAMPLCSCPDPIGSTLFNQVVVLDPGGVALTSATASTAGAK